MSSETVKKRVPTVAAIGKKIDKVFGYRAEKAVLESQVSAIKAKIDALEEELLDDMDTAGVKKAGTKLGTASVGSSVVANVEDWDAFLAYVYKNKYGHLLQRRVSDPAWRELNEQGKKVPGTVPFEKKRVNFRVAS